MKERPILFSAPMVRALLDGRKTQTRRVVKPHPYMCLSSEQWKTRALSGVDSYMRPMGSVVLEELLSRCPYGQPRDRLWVRETFAQHQQFADVAYRADGEEFEDSDGFSWEPKWKPSIHMPRNISRIDLEIIGVRVERLQDISEADCAKEGAPFSYSGFAPEDAPDWRGWYRDLWESINGPGSWDQNPWVWVIEFRRVLSDVARKTEASPDDSPPFSGFGL